MCAVLFASMMLGTCGLSSLTPVNPTPPDATLPVLAGAQSVSHSPIDIQGDDGFSTENGIVGGNGTESDPYLIQGWRITFVESVAPSIGIRVANTTSHFILRDVILDSGGFRPHTGVLLQNVTNCTIEDITVQEFRNGLLLESSAGIEVTGSSMVNSNTRINGSRAVSFSWNNCLDGGLINAASSDVSITDNNLSCTKVPCDYWGAAVSISDSTNCTVLRNDVWMSDEVWTWGYDLELERSTDCVIDGNSMSREGVSMTGSELTHFASHRIGSNNTVHGLPLQFRNGEDGALVTECDFGQLIIVNCTDSRVENMTLSGLLTPLRIHFCSGIDVEGCVFDNMSASLMVSYTNDARIQDNTFINCSEARFAECSGLAFSNNEFTMSPWTWVSFRGVANSTVEENIFPTDSEGSVTLGRSAAVTFRHNQLPTGGIRIDGTTVQDYASHDIEETNTIQGGKPVGYFANLENDAVDLSPYSQIIMANCTNTSAKGLTTDSQYAIQLGFVTNTSIHGCHISGQHPLSIDYSDRVTIYETDFMNAIGLLSLTVTHNVTIYHCNIYGSALSWSSSGPIGYVPMNIRWDNGYPEGGNYWESSSKSDHFRGANQDVYGSDGICDTPRDLGTLGEDRYPLVRPYASEDEMREFVMLWALAIAVAIAASGLVSYLLFVRRAPKKPEQPG